MVWKPWSSNHSTVRVGIAPYQDIAMIVNADQLKPEQINTYAGNVQLDVPAFKACTDSDKYKASVDKDIAGAKQAKAQDEAACPKVKW